MPEVCEGLLSWADATLERAEVVDPEESEESKSHVRSLCALGSSSLEETLLRLHLRESHKEPRGSSHVNPCRNLLDSLLRSDPGLPRLLLEAPYSHSPTQSSLVLKSLVGGLEKTLLEGLSPEDPLLNYFESQELPPVLLDLLEPKLWMEGCVLAEIRRSPSSFKTLLLRPSTQSMICDSNALASDGLMSQEERYSLEGELALLLSGPLCLDPSPVVSLVARKSLLSRQKLNTVPLRRMRRRKRPPETTNTATSSGQPLLDFIAAQRVAKGGLSPEEILAKHQACLRTSLRGLSSVQVPLQAPPLATDVCKRARTIQKRAEVNDMTPHVVEEYILETVERNINRVYHTRLTIYQRLANDEYLGELYVERDYRENDNKGSTCRFVLGTQPHALRYINQFTEIFTEEGRKSVKITHRVPNQPPRVTYTPGMRERLHERDKILVKNNNNNNNAATFNAMPKATQQQATRIIQFNNNASSPAATLNVNGNAVNSSTSSPAGSLSTPSILQTQLQRSTVFPFEDNNASSSSASLASQQQKDLEISAIKQALMKEGAEFEAGKSAKSTVAGTAIFTSRPANEVLKSNAPKLVSKQQQLSLHKILNAQAVQQQQQQIQISGNISGGGAVKLSRPLLTAGTLPSYSQAAAQQIKSKLLVSPSKIKTLGHDAPGLRALLANTPGADSPSAPNAANPSPAAAVVTAPGGSSLLERLVSGQTLVSSSASPPVSSSGPAPGPGDSTNDITLAALLAKPAAAASGGNSAVTQPSIYSSKMSPLLQQLQQPVRTSSSTRPHLSPRLISSPSPRPSAFANSQAKTLPLSSSTMISLPVQQSSGDVSTNVVSLQSLLSSVSNNNNAAGGNSSASSSTSSPSSIPVQLSIQGLTSPVTLSVNLSEGDSSVSACPPSSSTTVTGGGTPASSPNVFVTQQQKVGIPKIVTTGNHQTVLFQSPGNIIQLPSSSSSNNSSGGNQGSLQQQQNKPKPLLQVRQGQPLFLQVPSTQSKTPGQIQIVRTQSLVRPQNTPQQVVIKSSGASLLSPNSSNSSIPASPQTLSESNLVAIQLQQQNQQQQGNSQELILTPQQNISQIKVRQQRKTLK